MKTFLLSLILVVSVVVSAQNKSLPAPDSDLQTVTAGSYVIAMDNTLQTNTAGNFNLKTYGLVVHLLNNGVKLNWAIKSGKAKDAVDFSGLAEQIQPTYSIVALRNFKAGPFVIYAADTTGVAAMINTFYTSNGITGNERPKVYRITTSVQNVDIRYDMAGFRPKVVILNDGNNTGIHVGYMTKCAISSSNYNIGPATDLNTKCYTFASEPHNGNENAPTITAIKNFVQKGGNFLAQCAAIETYENSTYGRFHTTTGINVTNSGVNPTSTIYPNADLAFSQFEGNFDIAYTGSVKNWNLKSGSAFKNNEHNHTSGGSILSQSPIGASVAKLTGAALPGGLIFYLGSHDFSSITDILSINGIRMYMNAMLTPVTINAACNTGTSLDFPLPVKLLSFTANLDKDQSNVNLAWTTTEEINTSHFIVERSTDGIAFNDAGIVLAETNASGKKNYQLADNISSINTVVIYYRLRSVDIDGKSKLSETRIVRISKLPADNITILTYPNPASNELRITVPVNWQNKKVVYEILNTSGMVVKRIEVSNSSQTETINISRQMKGFYILKVTCNGLTASQKFIKQ